MDGGSPLEPAVLRIRQKVDLSWRKTNMTRFVRSTLAGLAVTAALAVSPASAGMMSFKADLNGASEVPPTPSEATGNIPATSDTTSKKLAKNGTAPDLEGKATAARS